MILEELVSKLGFEVEGLAKLKAAAKQFENVKNDVVAAGNPLKQAGASATVAAVGVGKLGAESKKSSRGVLLLSTAMTRLRGAAAATVGVLRTVLAVFLRIVGAVAGVAAGVAAIGTAFLIAGIRAAKARREFALTANTLGTTAQNLETGANILRYLGLGDEAQKGAEKAVGAINDVLKVIRAGGEEADEARKKFAGFGIDQSFQIDKNGQMRDSVAVLLDIVQAYKQVTEQAATYRKQADAIEKKNPKQAAALRKRALDRDRKATTLAEEGGIDGTFKAILDEKTTAEILGLIQRAQRERPTTSNASEAAQGSVAQQAEEAGLKVGALVKGLTDRLTEFGVAIAGQVLPSVNSFLDTLLSFAKRAGLIKETVGERDARLEQERESRRAGAFGGAGEETPQQRRNRTQTEAILKGQEEDRKRYGTPTTAPLPPGRPANVDSWRDSTHRGRQSENLEDRRRSPLPARDKDTSPAPPRTPTTVIRETQSDLPARMEALRESLKAVPSILKQVSPEANASKMQKAAEQKTENDNRSYSDIGNDKRTQNVTVNQTLQQDAAAIAAAARTAVLGAISTKGANTSTGALTAP